MTATTEPSREARELLAAELDTNHQLRVIAKRVRSGAYAYHSDADSHILSFALRAIDRALHRPVGEHSVSMDEVREAMDWIDARAGLHRAGTPTIQYNDQDASIDEQAVSILRALLNKLSGDAQPEGGER